MANQTTNDTGANNVITETFQTFLNELTAEEVSQNEAQLVEFSGSKSTMSTIKEKREYAHKKAEGLLEEYTDIKENISVKLAQSTSALITIGDDNLPGNGSIVEANTYLGELATHLDNSRTCIKEIHQCLLEVNRSISNLETALKDHCNKTEAETLEAEINLSYWMDMIKSCAEETCNEAGENFEEIKKSVIINAPLNLGNIIELGRSVSNHVSAFVTDITDNITAGTDMVSETRSALDAAIEELCLAESECENAENKQRAFATLQSLANPNAMRPRPATIDELLEQSEKNFDSVIKLIQLD